MGASYLAFNGARVTTAAPIKIATGNTIKTLMQLNPPSTTAIQIVEWGISFDGSAMAAPGVVELVETGTVGATVTAYVAANDFYPFDDPNAPTSSLTVGTTASGFTSSGEGTTTATRMFDLQLLDPIAPYVKQFPLGQQPEVKAGNIVRIRVTFGTTVNALCYIVWRE